MNCCPSEKQCVLGFDEFGFAVFRRHCDRWKQQHRSHEYSYPSVSTFKIELWQEMFRNWNETDGSCTNKIHRFLESGVPTALRGQLWKCLLGSERVKESSIHTYQDYVQELRSQLSTLGVNEYGVQMAVSTLDGAHKVRAGMAGGTRNLAPAQEPEVKIETLRQIVLDVERSFPTHCSLMGRSAEAKEGQAKLFRILSAYAEYNPQIGYCQGMSYIAAMLLMNMQEQDAFWALVVLLEKPKYLAGFYEHSLDTIQRHAKIFQQLLKHRMPCLWQHMENLKVAPLLFITTWFLTLFTSLPCWDTVLAIWDLIILYGINTIFSTGLCILQLLEPRLLAMSDVSHLLPTLLRIPVEVSRYSILVPALWMTKVHKWELDCMQSVVLEEEEEEMMSSGRHSIQSSTMQKATNVDKKNAPNLKDDAGKRSSRSSASTGRGRQETLKNTLTKMLKIARCYLQELGQLPKDLATSPSQDRSPSARGHTKYHGSKGEARRVNSRRGRTERTNL
ncbi:TBC1 domain family member 12 isoform X1 [Leucoraja erinacea]|uniref:TBC1 domain family member 12 isoform X1 n=2 Tax=Leucoraja erinaceus TaxID=7782 RepID=UPI0024550744|nr:TBC1 domain family member 12 isoform X1 [Leucoraja erinacea]XP_055505291.1 TBC1 domain family member 12 isoform X1 [Leucoraja erinacea]XP_055505292.1 TBC1 domain family member 12 isoform X1 [Leucoraja erinacea]XP_055505293.1 TBC1 domain family member 12 isoform X1 [Leucoraja erinacea]XP_055505294.1 TBC1 domain family member 12 isoform X1 [Leucoraja erinacea]